MEVKDLLQNSDGDINFRSGDFDLGLSDNQHQVDIIESARGAWKQFPICGVGIINYLNSSGSQGILAREITIQLTTDGYNVNEIVFNSDDTSDFTIDAVRN